MTEAALLAWLREELRSSGPRPLAAALARTAPPLARAALATERGLMDTTATRTALQDVQAPPLPDVPALPEVPATHREAWLRLLAAHLLAGTPWPAAPGEVSSSLLHDPAERLAHALTWSRARGKHAVYAAPSWAAAQTAQDWVEDEGVTQDMTVITLEEAVRTLGAAGRTRLRALGELLGQALILDGLHRLDVRGLAPVTALLEETSTFGLDVHVTGTWPHPLRPDHVPVPAGGRRVPFTFEAHRHALSDLLTLATAHPQEDTLVMLPSRHAALAVHAHLPHGRLTSRTKTQAHLREEQDAPGTLTLSTWSPSALTFRPYAHLITAPLPLPLLADACLIAGRVTLLPLLDFPTPSSAVTTTRLTLELLAHGAHPQDPRLHSQYWDQLLPHVQQDSLNIARSRQELNYTQTALALGALFRSGVPVLVDRPEAAEDVARARRTGRMPLASLHTARITPGSVQAARERGWLEEAGDALIWTGPYSPAAGVGVA